MPERIRKSLASARTLAPGLRLRVARRFPAVRLLLAVGVPIAAGFLSGCGDIRISGGASEIGNPAKAVLDDGSGQDAPSEVTGFGISARGLPVRVIRESRSAAEDASVAGTLPDSSHAGILPDDSLAPAPQAAPVPFQETNP